MIVLDSNLLLELLEIRRFYTKVVDSLHGYIDKGINFSISTLTVSNTFYLAERHKIRTDRVEKLIENYIIFDVLSNDVAWALDHYKGKDFEDALQIAAAIREKCTTFLTLDASLAKKYGKFLNIEFIGDYNF